MFGRKKQSRTQRQVSRGKFTQSVAHEYGRVLKDEINKSENSFLKLADDD